VQLTEEYITGNSASLRSSAAQSHSFESHSRCRRLLKRRSSNRARSRCLACARVSAIPRPTDVHGANSLSQSCRRGLLRSGAFENRTEQTAAIGEVRNNRANEISTAATIASARVVAAVHLILNRVADQARWRQIPSRPFVPIWRFAERATESTPTREAATARTVRSESAHQYETGSTCANRLHLLSQAQVEFALIR